MPKLSSLLAIALSLLALSGIVHAQDSPVLKASLAQRLLAQSLDVNEAEIRVAYVLSGTKRLEMAFETRQAATIIYLTNVVEDGARRRRCKQQVFLHDPELGWFLEEIVHETFRDYLRIWSEHKGYLELR